jgi:hypothetical protein
VAHGTPDYGLTAGTVTTYQLTDLAELAARLGSIDTFDRRGEVQFADGFECGLGAFQVVLSGAGAAIALVTTPVRSERRSAHFSAGTDAGQSARIVRNQAFAALSRFGLEFSVVLNQLIKYIQAQIIVYDGVNRTEYTIRFDGEASTITYADAAGVYRVITAAFNPQTIGSLFHTAKLVVDATARQYVRLLFDAAVYDLTTKAAQQFADATPAYISLTIALVSHNALAFDMYVDDVIWTQNEP